MSNLMYIYMAVVMLFSGVTGVLPDRARLQGSVRYDVSGEQGDADFTLDAERARVDYAAGDAATTYYVDRDGLMSLEGDALRKGAYFTRSLLEAYAELGGDSASGADYLPSGLLSDLAALQPHLEKLGQRVLEHPEWFELTVSDDGQTYERLAADEWYRLLWCRYARMTLDGETLRCAARELLRDFLSDPALLGDLAGLNVWSTLSGDSARWKRYSTPVTAITEAISEAYRSLNEESWPFHLTLTFEHQQNVLCLTVQNLVDGAPQGSLTLRASAGDAAHGGWKLEYQIENLYGDSSAYLQTGALTIRNGEARLTYYDTYTRDSLYASAEWDERGYSAQLTGSDSTLQGGYFLKGYFSYDDGFRHDAVLTGQTRYAANGSLATLCQTVKPSDDGGFTHDLSVSFGRDDGFLLHHRQSRAHFTDNDLTLTVIQSGRDAFEAELHQDQTALWAQSVTLALRQYGLPLANLSFDSAVTVLAGGYTARVGAEASIPNVGRYGARYESTYTPTSEVDGSRSEATLRLLNNDNEFFRAQASAAEEASRTTLSATCSALGMKLLDASAQVDYADGSRAPVSAEATLAVMGESFVLASRCEGALALTSGGSGRFALSATENGAETFGLLLARETPIKGDGGEWLLTLRSMGAELARVELTHAPAKEPDASDWSLRVLDASQTEQFALTLWHQLTTQEDDTLSHALRAEFTNAGKDSVQLESLLTVPR